MIDQNSTFGGFLTDVGEAKQANANALGQPWKLTHMLLGDANGTDPVPQPDQTALINQVYRAAINQLSVDPANPAILIAELVLPPNVGGWWIRELGLEDEDGDFVAVANCPPSYKPLLAQGSGRNQVVRMHLIVSNTANVQLKIDPSVVLATRKYVDGQRAAHEETPEAHAASQITIVTPIPQAPAAETVQQALAALGAFAGDGYQNIAVFDSAGTTNWAVPDVLKEGHRRAHVTVIGGGGGGGHVDIDTGAGGGGASGAHGVKMLDLTGVNTVPVTVGLGGLGRSSASGTGPGLAGGASSFGSYISCPGGTGGSTPSPGSTPTAVGGINIPVAPASSGSTYMGSAVGGGGGGGGGGGIYVPSSGKGPDAKGPGGGGAGGGGASGIRGGGDGADGIVIVRW